MESLPIRRGEVEVEDLFQAISVHEGHLVQRGEGAFFNEHLAFDSLHSFHLPEVQVFIIDTDYLQGRIHGSPAGIVDNYQQVLGFPGNGFDYRRVLGQVENGYQQVQGDGILL